jgi:hypothetical protein
VSFRTKKGKLVSFRPRKKRKRKARFPGGGTDTDVVAAGYEVIA